MAGNSASPGQSVSGRLLAVLDCFDVAHPTLTLTEIADRAGLPLSTARRLIAELVAWGGLERLPDGRHFRIGIRLWRIGSLAPRQRVLSEAAFPFMQDLCEATRENVQLAVLDDGEALCVEKISSRQAVPTATLVGGRLPLHATAVGKVLLAFSPPQVWRDLATAGLPALTRNTIVQPGRLASALEAVVEQGIAYSYEEMTLGAVSVAAPIRDASGTVQGALGIVTHSHLRVDQLGPAVRTAALGISRRLA
ncbi:DNA-binding IclR family transcriptional regulator [Amycolatopsis bartoniae]|uniref:IclR family transcriptional regulator n=1 Tax=Amycolatopsis bartoniae TaxID=941986 RepID=UPI001197B9BB|nr:IclR family transcriptional regulator [Amycolatopsis bartoniae]MBB2936517.1 DNA-binding IclR family transcriptional regulator [Amycolatopsis bartoniae]TVT11007.1 IclR family transcriptional regulator [Amycolatopsis bartoniae]